MAYIIKLVGRSLADFAQPPKGPTIVDFLQAQEAAREARLTSAEAGLTISLEAKGCRVTDRTVLPNGGIRLTMKVWEP